MNRYNNPHAMQGFPQGPMASPVPGYIQPGQQMQQPQYGPQRAPGGYQMQQGYGNPQQAYQPQQQPVYQPPPQQMQGVQIVNTQNGPFYMDVRSGQLIGPVNQQAMQPRSTAASAFQGQQHQVPTYQDNRFGNYQPSNQPQEYNMPDNRYGNIQQLAAQQPQERNNRMSPPLQQAPVIQTKPTQVVTDKNRRNLPGMKAFKHFGMPVMDTDIRIQSTSMVGSSLCHVVNTLIDEAHAKAKDRLVWIQPAIILRKFHDSAVKVFESELFQSDSELVFKAFRQKLSQVESRGDAAYFRAYNDWLTDAVNDYLRHASAGDVCIDSFAEDYGDVCKGLEKINNDLYVTMLVHMSDVLGQATADVLATREVVEPTDTQPGHVPDDNVAVIPERVTLVYIKLLSSELGDDGTVEGSKIAARIASNLKESIDEAMFHMVTLDRKFYKVFYMKDGSVDIRHLSN